MSADDPIATVSGSLAGSEFHRCAFQVNLPYCAGRYRGRASTLNGAGYARALADKAAELGLTALVVTDYNHVSGLDANRAAAREWGICVFPGFELASTKGILVLCLYPPETTEEQLNRFLDVFGIATPEPSSAGAASTGSDFEVTW